VPIAACKPMPVSGLGRPASSESSNNRWRLAANSRGVRSPDSHPSPNLTARRRARKGSPADPQRRHRHRRQEPDRVAGGAGPVSVRRPHPRPRRPARLFFGCTASPTRQTLPAAAPDRSLFWWLRSLVRTCYSWGASRSSLMRRSRKACSG
jgi:hypothetical protein